MGKTIHPLGARVLVHPIKSDNKTDGGIILPDSVGKVIQYGEIAGTPLGSDRTHGEMVVFVSGVGVPISKNGTDYLLIEEEDLLAIITDNE